jgi:AcrR family transcriptional regulator
MDAVAARAHASKATIYRRWPGKAALVVDALHCSKGTMSEPDTGSLEGDLTSLSQGSCSQESRFNAHVMLGLITALAHDVELRDVFRERMIEPRTKLIRQIFERAVARGEVSTERNLDLLVALFPALMIQQVLITGELPDADFALNVINDVILPLATASTDPRTS